MKILVVRLSSLGDILHMFPAVSDLHRHFPDAEIHWLVEPAFAEAVGWHSAINKVITIPLRAHKKNWWKIPALLSKLRQQLQAENYDIVPIRPEKRWRRSFIKRPPACQRACMS
jgi:heptosyltransferase-1